MDCFLPPRALQWNHSVVGEADFLPEWQAREQAALLAWSLQTPSHCGASRSLFRTNGRSSVPKILRFKDTVELFMGEDVSLDMWKVMVSHRSLASWPHKPWGEQIAELETEDSVSLLAHRPQPLAQPGLPHRPLQQHLPERGLPNHAVAHMEEEEDMEETDDSDDPADPHIQNPVTPNKRESTGRVCAFIVYRHRTLKLEYDGQIILRCTWTSAESLDYIIENFLECMK